MGKTENTPLGEYQIQKQSIQSADQLVVVTEDGIDIYELSIVPSISPEDSAQINNTVWPVAPDGFTGLLPTDKFK